jgi:hypothetical protein
MRLYHCVLWRSFKDTDPTIKYVWSDRPVETLIREFLDLGYVAINVTDITDVEVDSYEV